MSLHASATVLVYSCLGKAESFLQEEDFALQVEAALLLFDMLAETELFASDPTTPFLSPPKVLVYELLLLERLNFALEMPEVLLCLLSATLLPLDAPGDMGLAWICSRVRCLLSRSA